MGLFFLGTARANNTALQTSISDLEIVQTGSGAKLVSVSGPQGGVAAFQLNGNGVPTKQGHAFLLANQVTGGGHDIEIVTVGASHYVQVSGFSTNSVVSYLLSGSGSFSNKITLSGASIGSAAPVFARTEGGKTLLADPGTPGFYSYNAPGNASLQQQVFTGDSVSVFVYAVIVWFDKY